MEVSAEKFQEILRALQGVTVLKTPRVSRETLIEITRDHTNMLRGTKEELARMTEVLNRVSEEAAENKRMLLVLGEDSKKHSSNIDKLFKSSSEMRNDITDLNQKVAELFVLKGQVREQKERLEDLTSKFHQYVIETNEFVSATNTKMAVVDKTCNETQFMLKELKEYVDHFGDNLVLPASQIRVEKSAGFASRPISLLEVLTTCNANFEDAENTKNDHNARLVSAYEQLDNKAPQSLVFQVNGMDKKVTKIENILQKEEEQGVGAIRRMCEALTSDVQKMTSELNDKVNKDNVTFIVHEKYEEIVKYLQDALQSSAEDENAFKQKADELEEVVMKLAATKADRMEIAPLTEIIVKTEVMLKKVAGDSKKDKIKESYTKKEIEALLELKVDKATLEDHVSQITKGGKKKKLTSMIGNTNTGMNDEIGGLPSDPYTNETADKAVWKGISEAIKDEQGDGRTPASEAKREQNTSNDSERTKQLITQHQMAASNSAQPTSYQPIPLQHHNIQLQQQQQQLHNQLQQQQLQYQQQSHSQSQQQAQQHIHTLQMQQMAPNPGSSDFAAYIQNKRMQHMGKSSSTPAFASNHNPGAFRVPSEGGKPGGVVSGGGSQSSIIHNVSIPSLSSSYTEQFNQSAGGKNSYPNVPPEHEGGNSRPASADNPLNYLHGPVVGGGFNLKTKNLSSHKANLQPTHGFANDNTIDLETSGFTMRGIDGNLYYTDDANVNTSGAGQAPVPTAKHISTSQRK